MFSQLREIKRRQQDREKARRQTEQAVVTQRLQTTTGCLSNTRLVSKKPMQTNENRPIVNRSTVHTTKPVQHKETRVERSTIHKLGECPSSTSTLGVSSKVSSACSRPVSPARACQKSNLSFFCEEEATAKQEELPECEHLRQRLALETGESMDPQYLSRHGQLTENVRAILVEWIMELSKQFGLARTTFQQAVRLVDRFLSHSNSPVPRNRVQLVGVAALSVSCKFEEVPLRSLQEFSLATNSLYDGREIEDMECQLARAMRWRLRCPTTSFWIEPLIDAWTTFRKSLQLSDLNFNEEGCEFREQLQVIMYSVLDAVVLDAESLLFRPWQLVCSLMLLGLCYLHGELDLHEIECSLTVSAKYMLRSGITVVVRFGEFLRKALRIDLEQELTSSIRFVASYFFVCKRYPVTSERTLFCLQQQHSGHEMDFLARRRRLQDSNI